MYDELKERCRACSQGCIYPSECSYFDKPPLRCMRQLLSEAADAIEELTALSRRQEVELVELTGELASKPRWIPVSERLPEPYMSVLLYSGEKLYTGYMHSDKRFTVNDSRFPDRPTHWMPLPQGPEEE